MATQMNEYYIAKDRFNHVIKFVKFVKYITDMPVEITEQDMVEKFSQEFIDACLLMHLSDDNIDVISVERKE